MLCCCIYINVKENKGNVNLFEKQQLCVDGAKVNIVAEYTQKNSLRQIGTTVSQLGQEQRPQITIILPTIGTIRSVNASYLLCQYCDVLLSIPSILTKNHLSINICKDL